ncbi:hypothetical protein BDV29DRAFT_89929 [Aspergillus leporis]|uniref:DUF1279 domain-containing protein n=1 Tax=Aspergillus leporis TaxID=41062 RepID=A0A5N5X9W5_9EURO|nr:hypothetical protein BDV29DRAFT_89929 [Aspergillus leporis]
MPLRHITLSHWVSQPSNLAQHVLPSTITRTNVLLNRPSASLATFRRTFSLPANKSRFLTSRMKTRAYTFWNSPRTRQSPIFQRFFNSSLSKSSPQSEQSGSLSQRLKALSREYGWSALGVYLLLSAMDFPICFAAVRFLGAEQIGQYEDVVIESFKSAVGTVLPSVQEAQSQEDGGEMKTSGEVEVEAQTKTDEGASLWTQVALAYAIHKSLIFIRVPLTAGITPKVVKVLRQWGWDIVKGKPKGM